MKNLLVLAGGSPRNQAWGESCAEYFKAAYDFTHFVHYDHWGSGEPNLNIEAELKKIAEIVKGSGTGVEWYIFAKSIGSILALKAVERTIIAPEKCIFFGMPFSVVADSVLKNDWSLLTDFKVPAVAFHNDNDSTATYEYTKEQLATYASTITLETLSGTNHDYLDFASYDATIQKFLTKDI
jgi:hypothetical protein